MSTKIDMRRATFLSKLFSSSRLANEPPNSASASSCVRSQASCPMVMVVEVVVAVDVVRQDCED